MTNDLMKNTQTEHKLRADLPPLTPRIAKLPVDERGYPVPFFVAWVDGKPEFRLADPEKQKLCIRSKLCWVCGQPLGRFKSFLIGPMCLINRVSSEPPSHLDCALWSAQGCPFLARPHMVRREDEFMRKAEAMDTVPGIMIKRNPGVMVIWTCETFGYKADHKGGFLWDLKGEPESVSFWTRGQMATRAEILESIETGMPALVDVCRADVELKQLLRDRDAVMRFLPPATDPIFTHDGSEDGYRQRLLKAGVKPQNVEAIVASAKLHHGCPVARKENYEGA